MNKSFKFLLLTTAVLGCGVVFASSSSEDQIVVHQSNNHSATSTFSLSSLVPTTTPISVEGANQLVTSIRAKNLAVDSRMALIGNGLSSLQLAPGLVDRANNAITQYINALNTVDELSAAVLQMTTALFAHLNCDKDKINTCLNMLMSKTETLSKKEEYIRGIMSLLQAPEVQSLVARLEETKTSITLISEAFERVSQSPARSNRAASENQPNNQFSPGAGSHGEGSVHDDDNDEGVQNALD
jgi:hypothetical protein